MRSEGIKSVFLRGGRIITLTLALALALVLTLTCVFSWRSVRLKIGDYYYNQGNFDQAANWYEKVVRKEELKFDKSRTDHFPYREDLSKLRSALHYQGDYYFNQGKFGQAADWYGRLVRKEMLNIFLNELEERRLNVRQILAFDQTTNAHIKSAMRNLLMGLDFSKILIENSKTFTVDWMGQMVKIEGSVNLIDGPWKGSKALMVEGFPGFTKINGPSFAINGNEGSFSVWARLTNPEKICSDLVHVSGILYIYHQGSDGKFIIKYNDGHGSEPLLSIKDVKWHHYVFTWKEGEQKFYCDGHEVFAGTRPASTADNRIFGIGWFGGGNEDKGEQWHGPLAEFLTFDRALASREVSALYALRGSTDH